jgi:predicted alpha/beta-fold hydrolase
VLGRLKRAYAGIASRGAVPTPAEVVMRVRTLRDFDRLTVVPRFGFTSPEDYYARASAGPLLPGLAVPARLVACPTDPMVPRDAIAGPAARAPRLELSWVADGGHVGFPGDLDLGERGARGLERQLASWLLAR